MTKAVLLAGGLGTRLSEETAVRPKPMVEIGGKPILWHIMKIYAAHGITDFVVCLGYKGYVIKEYFANYYLHTSDVTFDLKQNTMTVHHNYADPPRIVFANDSVLIIPDRYRAFLPRFLAETSPVVGVTETDEKNYHISSWLFSVSRELWQQPFFRRYWRKLRPIHCRRHTIRAGELRLSACLTYHRVPFALMYPASVFMAALQKLPATAIEETLQYLPYGFLKGDPAVLAAESFRDVRWRVLSAQRGTNQTAFWQLVGLLHADFPFVKKDIYYRGVFSLAQMRLFFDAFDAVPGPDKHYIRDRVMAVRDPRTFGPVEKLRFLAGLE